MNFFMKEKQEILNSFEVNENLGLSVKQVEESAKKMALILSLKKSQYHLLEESWKQLVNQ